MKNSNSFLNSFILIITECLLFVYNEEQKQVKINKIKLTDVKTITLYKGKYAASRRVNPILQLKCIETLWKCQNYSPDVVECFNRGTDGEDVQWECKADLDKRVKFGYLKINCEGYDFPNDPYILIGSCRLQYSLESSRNKNLNEYYYNKEIYETSKLSNFLTLLIMIIIILAVYKSCLRNRQISVRRDINETYAHIITDSSNQPYNADVFPPPPPPYGFVINNPVNINTSIQDNQSEVTNSSQRVQKPELNNQNNESNVEEIVSTNSAGNLITGAAANRVGSFFITRCSSSNMTSRSDSPPPSYEGETNVAAGISSASRK